VNNAGVAGGIVNGENVVKKVRFLIVENIFFAIRDSSMHIFISTNPIFK